MQPTERRYKQQSTNHTKIPLEDDGSCYSIDSDLQERWEYAGGGAFNGWSTTLYFFLLFFLYLTYLYCHLRYPIFLSFKKLVIIRS